MKKVFIVEFCDHADDVTMVTSDQGEGQGEIIARVSVSSIPYLG